MKKIIIIGILISLGFLTKVAACTVSMSGTYYTQSGKPVTVTVTETASTCTFAVTLAALGLEQARDAIEGMPVPANPDNNNSDRYTIDWSQFGDFDNITFEVIENDTE